METKGRIFSSLAIASLLFAIGCLQAYHVSTIFENITHFSHLSEMEREMSFHSESGMYYSFYKRLIEAPSLAEGLDLITNDNLTEYPLIINTLKRFNLYPEVYIATAYRGYISFMDYMGWPTKQCWLVVRGEDWDPVTSCEGLGEPTNFYVKMVWAFAAITVMVVFMYGLFLSGSITGGVLAAMCYFYNHVHCTRVHFSPPLRENFAYPVLLLQMLVVAMSLRKSSVGHIHTRNGLSFIQGLIVIVNTLLTLLMWQFSQFVLATQSIALMTMYSFQFIPKMCVMTLLCEQSIGILLAIVLLYGNEMLLCSLLLCVINAALITIMMFEHNVANQIRNRYVRGFVLMFIFGVLTITIKANIRRYTGNKDDAHILNLLRSKFTNYKDFDTMLYSSAVEFNFLPLETIFDLTKTLLIPCAAIVGVAVLYNWMKGNSAMNQEKNNELTKRSNKFEDCNNVDPEVMYTFLQLGAFSIFALLIMRLKLLFTPHLCIVSGMLASKKYFNFLRKNNIHWTVIILIVSGMGYQGIVNVNIQRGALGEYNDAHIEELLLWVKDKTPPNSVFAGSMSVMASLLLCTKRPIVNHPHYENANLRERTKKVYSVYSRRTPQEVYHNLVKLHVEYVVLEAARCFMSGLRTYSMVEIWDIVDPQFRHRPEVCPVLYQRPSLPFHRVFLNEEFTVLRLQPQYVEIKQKSFKS